jgi:hypothetical protein
MGLLLDRQAMRPNGEIMPSPHIYCRAVGRAIRQLDQFSLRGPENGPDKDDWDEARRLLLEILDRNGYELTVNRIRKRKNP